MAGLLSTDTLVRKSQMHQKQINAIMRRPMDHIKFVTTGQLPRMVKPESPLIDVLKSLTPRERLSIVGLRVDRTLGYTGCAIFTSAETALRWLAPNDLMLERDSWPAESRRMKQFNRLTLADVLANATRYPQTLVKVPEGKGGP
jgi:hypothetical protein